jgi:hypothetical protein
MVFIRALFFTHLIKLTYTRWLFACNLGRTAIGIVCYKWPCGQEENPG